MLSQQEIDTLQAAHRASTAGEWDWHQGTSVEQNDFTSVEVHPSDDPVDTVILLQGGAGQVNDVEFIALAHNLMPSLLSMARTSIRQEVALADTRIALRECLGYVEAWQAHLSDAGQERAAKTVADSLTQSRQAYQGVANVELPIHELRRRAMLYDLLSGTRDAAWYGLKVMCKDLLLGVDFDKFPFDLDAAVAKLADPENQHVQRALKKGE